MKKETKKVLSLEDASITKQVGNSQAEQPKAKAAKVVKEPKAKAKKKRPSTVGINAFIHEQAALGKSAKEIAQLAHDTKWPQVYTATPAWINGIQRAMDAGAKSAQKKALKAAQKAKATKEQAAERKVSKVPPAKAKK